MSAKIRSNLLHQLQDDIIKTDILFDVGYGDLHDLADFENSAFKKIIGLDNQVTQPFRVYRNLKGINYDAQQHIEFRKRFSLSEEDFTHYDFGIDQNSMIICSHVLHFYDDKCKLEYLQRFYRSLQNEGLIYLKLNHLLNKDNTDPEFMNNLGGPVFQNKAVPEDIRYLVDPNEFLRLIRSAYPLLEKHTTVTAEDLSFVIRKV